MRGKLPAYRIKRTTSAIRASGEPLSDQLSSELREVILIGRLDDLQSIRCPACGYRTRPSWACTSIALATELFVPRLAADSDH
jgi:hypothetical protein